MQPLSIASILALLSHTLACPLSTDSTLPRSIPEPGRPETFLWAGLKTYVDINCKDWYWNKPEYPPYQLGKCQIAPKPAGHQSSFGTLVHWGNTSDTYRTQGICFYTDEKCQKNAKGVKAQYNGEQSKDMCVAHEDSGQYSSFIFVPEKGHSPCELVSHTHARALPASTESTPILSEREDDSACTDSTPTLSERSEDSASTNDTLILTERAKFGDFTFAGLGLYKESNCQGEYLAQPESPPGKMGECQTPNVNSPGYGTKVHWGGYLEKYRSQGICFYERENCETSFWPWNHKVKGVKAVYDGEQSHDTCVAPDKSGSYTSYRFVPKDLPHGSDTPCSLE